ncbi:MAG: enterotoxin [Verrucomicrobia bacterium]|jgi:hypothetical protein|nr:enterotoxin [Verrucomicrobiota bacterium]MBT7066990.1 enterotoxin [Verrucomicrobiota bacterium]MBT7701888.1 enterotoxin [Verrucomicrobiota bacterium]
MPIKLTYPARQTPGAAVASLTEQCALLENSAMRCSWQRGAHGLTGLRIENLHTSQVVEIDSGFLPQVVLESGRIIDMCDCSLTIRVAANALMACCDDEASGLSISLSVSLENEMNAVIQTLRVTASRDTAISNLNFFNSPLPGAEQMGEVQGSVVVCETVFMGVENPLARNVVGEDGLVQCSLPQSNVLKAGASWEHSCSIGVTPGNQLRRGFAYYIDRRRAHPYRPHLQYNNWYDVWLGRPLEERMTEEACIDAIHYYGKELVQKRKVVVDAVVWDDGWDDYKNSLWEFNSAFPDGFRNLVTVAEEYGIAQGVWLSPNGGYAYAKEARVAYGESQGYETNETGFATGGPRYAKAFREACIRMMRDNGVIFFKFDGMGDGGQATGNDVKLSDDINGVLALSKELREEMEDVYISATCGTWASPYWLLYADSIWRQGGDTGHHGAGDTRQQWITYRDMFTHNRVVKAGPLYPINSLMLHGILIGDRRAPAGMAFDEKSLADEAWTFFGSGTCLQELYVSPHIATDAMLDTIAEAANWGRANAGTLIDTHWIGGNPEHAETYGWAAWQPGKGIVTLRNPSDEPRTFTLTLRDAFEFPEGIDAPMTLSRVYAPACKLPQGAVDVGRPIELALQPWEVVVFVAE